MVQTLSQDSQLVESKSSCKSFQHSEHLQLYRNVVCLSHAVCTEDLWLVLQERITYVY